MLQYIFSRVYFFSQTSTDMQYIIDSSQYKPAMSAECTVEYHNPGLI